MPKPPLTYTLAKPTTGGAASVREQPARFGAAAETADTALVQSAQQRVARAFAQALDLRLSVGDLQAIVSERTDAGAAVALLDRLISRSSLREADPLLEARTRGLKMRESLLEAAGGTFTTEDVATLLGCTRQAVEARRDRGTLLAIPAAGGTYVYPKCQFTPDGVLPGLSSFLKAFPHDVEPVLRLNVLLGDTASLGGRSPLDLLRAGEIGDAVDVAAAAFDAP